MASTNTDPSNTPQVPAKGDASLPEASDQTPKITDQQDTNSPPTVQGYTQEQVAELLKKAREEEKNKVFSKLEAAKSDKEKVEAALQELEATKKQLEADRDALREGRATELKSVNDELGQLREQNKKLEQSFQASLEASAKKIREQELKAYKAEKVRVAQIKGIDFVQGNDEAEIDAAIEKVKIREAEIAEQLREEVRRELANDLPRPISTDGSVGKGPTGMTLENRQSMVQLTDAEYQKARQQALNEAKQKAGYTR